MSTRIGVGIVIVRFARPSAHPQPVAAVAHDVAVVTPAVPGEVDPRRAGVGIVVEQERTGGRSRPRSHAVDAVGAAQSERDRAVSLGQSQTGPRITLDVGGAATGERSSFSRSATANAAAVPTSRTEDERGEHDRPHAG